MAKLSHRILRNKIVEHNWKQEALAEQLNISDRHVRNLCTRDTNAYVSLCYDMSQLFGTTIEELLTTSEAEK